jgi:[protein-PII] uridylyltransferase
MRRDLDDPTTIERVAKEVVTVERLDLLAALTEADSLATGPSAWGRTKQQLVEQLVERVRVALSGATPNDFIAPRPFPSEHHLGLLAEGGRRIDVSGEVLTVVTDDRPGLFSRVAGVLALHGLDVVSASAHSTETGRALSQFAVIDRRRSEIPWQRVLSDLELALDGRLALAARLAERARTYGRSHAAAALSGPVTVRFDDDASAESTVIDVQAPDAVGVLYRITHALAELDLDIRSARIQTLGHQVVDAFYVRDRSGNKLSDRHLRGEIERALAHSISQ